MTTRLTGILFIVLSAVAFGAMPIFARFAYADGVTPVTLLFLRFTIAATCLIVVAAVRRLVLPRGRTLGILIAMGIGYCLQALTYFTALTMASAGLAALLLYINPAIVAVLAVIFLHEPFNRRKGLALLLALVGTALTVGNVGDAQPLGIALSLLAALMYAVYILVGSRVAREVSALQSSTVIITAAALSFAVLALLQGVVLPASATGWAAIVGIAIFSTIIPILAFFAGIERVGATNAATLSTVEPLVTIGLAALLLGESITVLRLVGGALILLAVIILARTRDKAKA
jgi:drug/metabolite transporter (DMT)-like permease